MRTSGLFEKRMPVELHNDVSISHGKDVQSLIFLHIPKTAGTTLSRIIEKQYPGRAVYTTRTEGGHARSLEDFKALDPSQRNEIRCLKGHIPFGMHAYLRQPCVYITLLREPVDRIISHYYFVLKNPRHYLHKQVIEGHMTLDDYVSSGISTELSNGQTRMLADRDDESPSAMLGSAKKNLCDHFAVVGLTESFDESLLLMKHHLGWRRVYYARENVTPGRPLKSQISRSTVHLIEQANEADLKLYAFAREQFEKKICAQGPHFPEVVRRFRSRNRVFGIFEGFHLGRFRMWYHYKIRPLLAEKYTG
jgi:hypothetical protein